LTNGHIEIHENSLEDPVALSTQNLIK